MLDKYSYEIPIIQFPSKVIEKLWDSRFWFLWRCIKQYSLTVYWEICDWLLIYSVLVLTSVWLCCPCLMWGDCYCGERSCRQSLLTGTRQPAQHCGFNIYYFTFNGIGNQPAFSSCNSDRVLFCVEVVYCLMVLGPAIWTGVSTYVLIELNRWESISWTSRSMISFCVIHFGHDPRFPLSMMCTLWVRQF